MANGKLPERKYQTIQEFADDIGASFGDVMHYIAEELLIPSIYITESLQVGIFVEDVDDDGNLLLSWDSSPTGETMQPVFKDGWLYLRGYRRAPNQMEWEFLSDEATPREKGKCWYQLPETLRTPAVTQMVVMHEEKQRFIRKHLKVDIHSSISAAYELFDEDDPYYPQLLDIAVQAWTKVNKGASDFTPKEAIRNFLLENYERQLSTTNIEEIAKICNWDKRGGRPKAKD